MDSSINSELFFISQEPVQQVIRQRRFTTKLMQVCTNEIMLSDFVFMNKVKERIKE